MPRQRRERSFQCSLKCVLWLRNGFSKAKVVSACNIRPRKYLSCQDRSEIGNVLGNFGYSKPPLSAYFSRRRSAVNPQIWLSLTIGTTSSVVSDEQESVFVVLICICLRSENVTEGCLRLKRQRHCTIVFVTAHSRGQAFEALHHDHLEPN